MIETNPKITLFGHMKRGFVAGIGWSFGVTFGFILISALFASLINFAGGLPLIGSFFADVVHSTQTELQNRNPYYR